MSPNEYKWRGTFSQSLHNSPNGPSLSNISLFISLGWISAVLVVYHLVMDISSLLNTSEAQPAASGQPLHVAAALPHYHYSTPLKIENADFLGHFRRDSVLSAGSSHSSDYFSHGSSVASASSSPVSSASSTPRLPKRRLTGSRRATSSASPYSKPQKNRAKNEKERMNRAELCLSISMVEKTLRTQNPQLPHAEGWKLLTKHNSENRNIEPGRRLEHNKQSVMTTNLDFLNQDYALLSLAQAFMSRYDAQFAQAFQRMIELRGKALTVDEIQAHERRFRDMAFAPRPGISRL